MGSVSLALAMFIRGIEATNPLPAKFALSLAYTIISLLHMMYLRCRQGDAFLFPWQREDQSFSKLQFGAVMLGGVVEFLSSIGVMMALDAASEAGINQGISTAIMVIMTVEVTVFSFFFFHETISCP